MICQFANQCFVNERTAMRSLQKIAFLNLSKSLRIVILDTLSMFKLINRDIPTFPRFQNLQAGDYYQSSKTPPKLIFVCFLFFLFVFNCITKIFQSTSSSHALRKI